MEGAVKEPSFQHNQLKIKKKEDEESDIKTLCNIKQ